MRLGMQQQFMHVAAAGLFDEPGQHCVADALSAPAGKHRHAADVPIGEQPAGADRIACRILGEYMLAGGIELVPFEFLRHALLLHEHRQAHRPQGVAVARPVGVTQSERWHAPIIIGASSFPEPLMRSRWNHAEATHLAAQSRNPALAARAYTSRLLGAEQSLVLHGGGNTSMKRDGVLYVKGSGRDLAQAGEEDFAAVDLAAAAALASGGELDNHALRTALGERTVRPGPGASIETLMHALLPWPFVEHTHADAVLAVVDTRAGARIAAHVFGDLAPLVPFHPSGFALAKACDAVYRQHATRRTIGLILLHHGVVAFGRDPRESYENMLALVTRAEDYLRARNAWDLPEDPHPFSWDPLRIARLRAHLCRVAGHPMLLAALDDPYWRSFARRPDLLALCSEGPATPQHAVFLRARALVGTDLDAFAHRYAQAVHATHPDIGEEVSGFDFAPRVLLDPELGAWVAAVDPEHLRMAQDVARQDREIKTRAAAHDRYAGLPVSENIEAEIQYGSAERRVRIVGRASRPLLGQSVLMRMGRDDGGLEADCIRRGAAVYRSDVLAPVDAVRGCMRQFGAIDLLVTDEADPALLDAAAPVLAAAPDGGRVVVLGDARATPSFRERCTTLGLAIVQTVPEAA